MVRCTQNVVLSPRLTLLVNLKLSLNRFPHMQKLTPHTHHFFSHIRKHISAFFLFPFSNHNCIKNNHDTIFITACPFQVQTSSIQGIFMMREVRAPTSIQRINNKKKTPPICAHFRLNMNWTMSPPFEAVLASAVLGYLIWTPALGSQKFIQ